MTNPSDDELRRLLADCRTVAVVGLSSDPARASYAVAAYLKAQGYRILPVNPNLSRPVLGAEPFASLAELQEPVDVVDVFRREDEIPHLARQALALPERPRLFWQQLGLRSRPAQEAVVAAGVVGVFDRCLKVEHARLFTRA